MFAAHAGGAIAAEQGLHAALLADLGLTAEAAAAAPVAPTTRAYVSYLLATAHGGSFAEAVAAVLPCYWIYARVGEELLDRGSPDPLYARWIAMYGGEEFQAVVDAVLDADRPGRRGGLARGAGADARARGRDLALRVDVLGRGRGGGRRGRSDAVSARSTRFGISRCSTTDTTATTIAPQNAAQNPSTTNGRPTALGEPADEQEQQRVHHQPDQPEGEDVEGAAEGLDDRLHHSLRRRRRSTATPTSCRSSDPVLPAVDGDPGDDQGRDPQRDGDDRDPDERERELISPPAPGRPARAAASGSGTCSTAGTG